MNVYRAFSIHCSVKSKEQNKLHNFKRTRAKILETLKTSGFTTLTLHGISQCQLCTILLSLFSYVHSPMCPRTRNNKNVLGEELYPCDRKRMSKACTVRVGACPRSWCTSRDSWRMHAYCNRRRTAVVRAPPHLLNKCILCSYIPLTLSSTHKVRDHTKMLYIDILLALIQRIVGKKK